MEKMKDDPDSVGIWHLWKFTKDAFSIFDKKITATLIFLFHTVRAKPESDLTSCVQSQIYKISSREICHSAIATIK